MTPLFLLSGCLIDWKLYNERLAELQARESGCDLATVWVDADGDGYGDAEQPEALCAVVEGYAEQPGDCDDGDPEVNPGGVESCATEADDDCDGEANEEGAADGTPWYADADGDGYGDAGESVLGCAEIAGRVSEATDCDDGDAEMHPGAEEECGTGVDEDCDDDTTECRWEGEVSTAEADVTLEGGVGWVSRVGDLRGDGGDDIAIADDDTVYLVSDPGDGVFATGEVAFGRVTVSDPEMRLIRATAGDFDGDGVADVAVSAADDDLSGTIGGVYVFSGTPTDATTNGTWATIEDADAGIFGFDIRSVGDVNDDGLDELLVGAPTITPGEGGVAYLFQPTAGDLSPFNALATLRGQDDDAAGYITASADVSGDGVVDLVVGAPMGEAGSGVIYVVFGPVSAGIDLVDSDVWLVGAAQGDLFGLSAATEPFVDADGDGDTDLLVGAWQQATVANGAGAAYLFAGPLGGVLGPEDAVGTYQGAHADAGMGYAVSGAHDLDGDGRGDLVIGAYGNTTGRTYVMYGPAYGTYLESDLDTTFVGAYSDSRLGMPSISPDDMDGDGLSDVVIGDSASNGGDGALHLFRGRSP